MATLLTKSYQEVSRISLTYGDLVTYAKYSTQSKENNTTTYQLKTVISMQGYYNEWSFESANAYLDDSHKVYGFTTFYRGDTTIQEITRTSTHNTDGSSKTVEFYSAFYASYGGGGESRPQITFPKIDRYASLTSGTNFTDETNPVYTISNFDTTHTIRVKIEAGGDTQLITRDLAVGYSGTYTLELTSAERDILRALTPNSNTLVVRETVVTMNNGSEISGSANFKDYTMTIVNANPTYTYTIEEQNANVISVLGTDDASTIIENVSQVEIAITPTPYKSATISNVKLTHNNTAETKTSSPYVFTKDVKASSFVITVTDSRTNYVENTITKTLISYTPVKINSYSLVRQNSTSSNVILNLQATYTQTTFGSTANVPTVKWKLDDGSYTTIPSSEYIIDTTNNTLTITNYTLSNVLPYTDKGYFSLEVSDLLTSNVENEILVIKGIPTFDYGEHDLKVNGDLYVADTDGNNAVNILDEIENLKGKILWKNPNPSASSFGSQQITLNSDDYEYYEVIVNWNTLVNRTQSSGKVLKGSGSVFNFVSSVSYYRTFNYVSDTTLEVNNATAHYFSNNTDVTDNEWFVPLYVIGYKTELFS